MSNPFFSIIIPTYNSSATLTDCIESIVAQSFNNLEVLIIDAVSNDNTIKIAESYSTKLLSIKIVSEKDKGIYDAMNKGIKLSTGSWLYFMGSDDKLYDSTILQSIVETIDKNPGVEIVYGNVFSERFNGLYDGAFSYSKILKKNISHQAIFFNKKVFEKTGYFDLKYKAQSDWDHNLKWILSEKIEKKYVELTIAFYADGGFSSLHGDTEFNRDLRTNYLRYGKKTLPFRKKILVLVYELLKAIKRGDLKRARRAIESF